MILRVRRAELFDRVWKNPVLKVARDIGISDVALHKICRKHQIPVPPRGYWAKVAARKPVPVPKLPDVAGTDDYEIEIVGPLTAGLDPEVLKAAKARSSGWGVRRVPTSASMDSYRNPYLEELQRLLEPGKPRRDGFIRLLEKTRFKVAVTPATGARTVLTLRRLSAAAEARGYAFQPTDQGLALCIEDELIALSVSELLERRRHEPTALESAKLSRWESEYARKVKRQGWATTWDRPSTPEWDEVPSGRLVIEIDNPPSTDGLRRRFSDGKRQRIEDMSEKILLAANACSVAIKKKREAEAEFNRKLAEDRKRRQEAERRRRLLEKRWQCVDLIAKHLSEASRLEHMALNYRAAFGDRASVGSIGEFLTWADNETSRIRAKVDPELLGAAIERFDLMNEEAEIESWVDFTLKEPR